MMFAAASTGAIAIDPTLLALIPVLTVALTVFAGFIGAAIQGRREHVRWVRERRYEAFVAFATLTNKLQSVSQGRAAAISAGRDPQADAVMVEMHRDVLAAFPGAVAPLHVLGPTSVEEVADEVMGLLGDEAKNHERRNAEQRLSAEMRKALGVKS